MGPFKTGTFSFKTSRGLHKSLDCVIFSDLTQTRGETGGEVVPQIVEEGVRLQRSGQPYGCFQK